MTTKDLTLKLDRARWWAISNPKAVFYSQLAMSLPDKFGNPAGKTACTDGRKIMWDADFLAKLTDAETRFVLLHETLHCAHAHLWRFPVGSCDHATANQACDHAINLLLKSAFGDDVKMPDGGLADSQFTGMAEEEIYNALSQKQKPETGDNGKPQAGQGDDGQGQDGDSSDSDGQGKPGKGKGKPQSDPCGDYCAPADDGQDGEGQGNGQDDTEAKPGKCNLREEWERKIIQAAQAAKASGQGNVPGDMARLLDRMAACPIDWRRETADFIKQAASTRNDWTRSPRRHAWQPVIYPRRRQNEVGCIVGVRDTSGSIDDKLAAEFSAILAAACAELNCGLILLDCDTDIAAEYRIEPGGEVPLTAQGGGGTDFAAPFARARKLREQGEQISGLVYLTDLCGSGWPSETDNDLPTLCICTEDSIAPSGRTIRVL